MQENTKLAKIHKFIRKLSKSLGKKISDTMHKSFTRLDVRYLLKYREKTKENKINNRLHRVNFQNKDNLLNIIKSKHSLTTKAFAKVFFSKMLEVNLGEAIINKNFAQNIKDTQEDESPNFLHAILQQLIAEYAFPPHDKPGEIFVRELYDSLNLSAEAKSLFRKLQSYSANILEQMHNLSDERQRSAIKNCFAKLDEQIEKKTFNASFSSIDTSLLSELSPLAETIELSPIYKDRHDRFHSFTDNPFYKTEESIWMGDQTVYLTELFACPNELRSLRNNIMLVDLRNYNITKDSANRLFDSKQQETLKAVKEAQDVVRSLLKQALAVKKHMSIMDLFKTFTYSLIDVVVNIFDKLLQFVSLGYMHIAWRTNNAYQNISREELAKDARNWVNSLGIRGPEGTSWVEFTQEKRQNNLILSVIR